MLKVSARLFPIGYIISVDAPNFDPHDFYIDGNWERIKGRVIVGVDEAQTEFNAVGKTGGNKLLQSHSHKFRAIKDAINTDSGGGGVKANNGQGNNYGYTPYGTDLIEATGGGNSENLQPYQTAYVWKLISYSN